VTAHALPALYRAAAQGLATLADLGYDGAGIGIHIPLRDPSGNGEPDTGTRTYNALQRSLRCLGERGFALLTGRWRALQHITLSPSKIGDIARAALVLTHFEHGHIR
jgi:DDE superfamily endonuclease